MEQAELKAVFFDWGDTVMVNYPEYSGPMASWPVVSAVPGAPEVLRTLSGKYVLGLLTNAGISDTRLVKLALARLGLVDFFKVVLTSQDLGAKKPDAIFFTKALEAVGCLACEAVMVGDNYDADIRGAKMAGLRTVWYNPSSSVPPHGQAYHDCWISHLAALPGALAEVQGGVGRALCQQPVKVT